MFLSVADSVSGACTAGNYEFPKPKEYEFPEPKKGRLNPKMFNNVAGAKLCKMLRKFKNSKNYKKTGG